MAEPWSHPPRQATQAAQAKDTRAAGGQQPGGVQASHRSRAGLQPRRRLLRVTLRRWTRWLKPDPTVAPTAPLVRLSKPPPRLASAPPVAPIMVPASPARLAALASAAATARIPTLRSEISCPSRVTALSKTIPIDEPVYPSAPACALDTCPIKVLRRGIDVPPSVLAACVVRAVTGSPGLLRLEVS
jgi:hypothetical protein